MENQAAQLKKILFCTDFSDNALAAFEAALKVAAMRHDLSVIRVHDPREETLPAVGPVHVKDAETGEARWINTDSKRVRQEYQQWFASVGAEAEKLLRKYQVGSVDIRTDEDYVRSLRGLFEKI